MKKQNRILIYLLIMGIFLIHANSCKKIIDNTIPTDADGNVYKTVTIGTQIWMSENLNTTRFRNGDLIGTTAIATADISGESTPKYQWAVDGNETNTATYGRLYTWYTVTDTRKVCPTGWHLPSLTEWTELSTYLGGESIAGGKLKEVGTSHWLTPNTGATNETGFNALPGGFKSLNGFFNDKGNSGNWWSSTESSGDNSSFIWADSQDANLYILGNDNKKVGYSVRCIKD